MTPASPATTISAARRARPPIDAPPGVTIVDVPAGDITTDTTWTADHIYVLEGYVFVTGGTLTIEPGTRDQGRERQRAHDHEGREARRRRHRRPSRSCSRRASATPASGDWGGVVLLGKAPINVTGGTNNDRRLRDLVRRAHRATAAPTRRTTAASSSTRASSTRASRSRSTTSSTASRSAAAARRPRSTTCSRTSASTTASRSSAAPSTSSTS